MGHGLELWKVMIQPSKLRLEGLVWSLFALRGVPVNSESQLLYLPMPHLTKVVVQVKEKGVLDGGIIG